LEQQIPPLRCGMTARGQTRQQQMQIQGFFASLRMTAIIRMATLS
jgi:hypothetical protein